MNKSKKVMQSVVGFMCSFISLIVIVISITKVNAILTDFSLSPEMAINDVVKKLDTTIILSIIIVIFTPIVLNIVSMILFKITNYNTINYKIIGTIILWILLMILLMVMLPIPPDVLVTYPLSDYSIEKIVIFYFLTPTIMLLPDFVFTAIFSVLYRYMFKNNKITSRKLK